jgi:hypothetical protein
MAQGWRSAVLIVQNRCGRRTSTRASQSDAIGSSESGRSWFVITQG